MKDDIVEVIVGPQKTVFKVHEGILTNAADFFARAFQGGFKESETKKLQLPSFLPDPFNRFMHYCYTGLIADIQERLKVKTTDLTDLWIIGDFLGLPNLQNDVMNCLVDQRKDDATNAPWPGDIYKNTREDSPLRTFVLDCWIESGHFDSLPHLHGDKVEQQFTPEIWMDMMSRAQQWMKSRNFKMPHTARNYRV